MFAFYDKLLYFCGERVQSYLIRCVKLKIIHNIHLIIDTTIKNLA